MIRYIGNWGFCISLNIHNHAVDGNNYMSLCKYFQLVVFFSSNHWWRYKLYQNIWLFEKYTLFLRLYPLCYTKVQSYCWKYSIFLGISDSNLIDLESHGAHIGTFNQWHSLINKSLKRRKSKVSNTSRQLFTSRIYLIVIASGII